MDRPVDPIGEADLQAYVEDQLPVARRIEVEAYLCHHPDEAMRVMSDLRIRDELRLALAAEPSTARIETLVAARRLEGGLARSSLFRRVRQIAAVGVLITFGWLAHAEFGPLMVGEVVASAIPPAYVGEAVRAHRTALVRASMRSQPGASDYDPAEIRAATAIVLPQLPKDWQVKDVQIFPSSYGPSVELAARTETLGEVSLFAVRPGAFDVIPATVTHDQDVTAAYWQIGDVAYALVAKADARDIDEAAIRLARSLY
ncbi:anti-sigma factor [Aquabacter sp. CN5-332]|uniref:anti-sigma factor family protein n=1 Tax=Aquabacter sp. CN5-332 TaxID=3156608 RepID=UPI0032B36AAB